MSFMKSDFIHDSLIYLVLQSSSKSLSLVVLLFPWNQTNMQICHLARFGALEEGKANESEAVMNIHWR